MGGDVIKDSLQHIAAYLFLAYISAHLVKIRERHMIEDESRSRVPNGIWHQVKPEWPHAVLQLKEPLYARLSTFEIAAWYPVVLRLICNGWHLDVF
ncbi:hypothetical protein CIW51_17570 [Mycolicibacterium sp. P9-22]|nr:hypothetical protein CIW51_17570 [Mycolicibacterium sp. P9-22]